MAIEVLDDIIEQLADQLGVYGANTFHNDECRCRVCWTSSMKSRILEAVRVENALNRATRDKYGVSVHKAEE